MRAQIIGTGRSVPEARLTNADLERQVETSDEWIVSRTGIKERRIARPEEAASSFAIPAVEAALENAGVAGSDVDLVICCTVTSDMFFPATASLIQEAIGARQAGAFDLGAGCAGFVYGLSVASQFVQNGAARTVAVVGCEVLSKFVDWQDRSTCVLFGDGAGAVILRGTDDERGILHTSMRSDGSLAELIHMPGGGSRHPPSPSVLEQNLAVIKMQGHETFKLAVRAMADAVNDALAASGLEASQVRWFIPHQANRRIIDAVGQRLEIPTEATYVNISRYGNTSAASIPIALDELNRGGELAADDVLLFAAFGAGLTWGASVVRW